MCKICPKCGGIAEFNAYYGRITCTRCVWESEKINSEDSKKYTFLKEEPNLSIKIKKEKVIVF